MGPTSAGALPSVEAAVVKPLLDMGVPKAVRPAPLESADEVERWCAPATIRRAVRVACTTTVSARRRPGAPIAPPNPRATPPTARPPDRGDDRVRERASRPIPEMAAVDASHVLIVRGPVRPASGVAGAVREFAFGELWSEGGAAHP